MAREEPRMFSLLALPQTSPDLVNCECENCMLYVCTLNACNVCIILQTTHAMYVSVRMCMHVCVCVFVFVFVFVFV